MEDFVIELPSGTTPDIRREVVRLSQGLRCGDGRDCQSVALAEAFRWNGLNLASIDAQLGRYFGTSEGVLVLSARPELAGLQSGDVIRKVDGKAVSSPREVMDVLRGKAEGASVSVDYLRDRRSGTAQLKAPKALRIPLPPAPPAPPRPAAPPAPPAAPPAPPAAPPPPPPAAVAFAPVPPAPPAFPALPRVD